LSLFHCSFPSQLKSIAGPPLPAMLSDIRSSILWGGRNCIFMPQAACCSDICSHGLDVCTRYRTNT
jgi:hypothetical protein